jgi:hypothetical protein
LEPELSENGWEILEAREKSSVKVTKFALRRKELKGPLVAERPYPELWEDNCEL